MIFYTAGRGPRQAVRHPGGHLRHAISQGLPRASRTGLNYRAVCGASVPHVNHTEFEPEHARACKACVIYVRARN